MDCSKNLRGTSKKCRLEGFFRTGMEDLWDSLLAISPGILKDASSFMIFDSLYYTFSMIFIEVIFDASQSRQCTRAHARSVGVAFAIPSLDLLGVKIR